MPTIEELREITARAIEENAQKAKLEKKAKEEAFLEKVSKQAQDVISRVEEDIPKVAAKGSSSICAMGWYSGPVQEAVSAKVSYYFRSKGFETSVHAQEPVGSDPMFFHTVYDLYIHW